MFIVRPIQRFHFYYFSNSILCIIFLSFTIFVICIFVHFFASKGICEKEMSYKKQQGLILRDAYIMWGYSILESNNPKKSMGYRSQMNTMYLSKSMRRKAPEMRATINKKMENWNDSAVICFGYGVGIKMAIDWSKKCWPIFWSLYMRVKGFRDPK